MAKNGEVKEYEVIRSCFHGGELLEHGAVVSLPGSVANPLIGLRKIKPYEKGEKGGKAAVKSAQEDKRDGDTAVPGDALVKRQRGGKAAR